MSVTPVKIVRAEVCSGHNAPRISRSHRHNARYTINEQEQARRKRLLNPGRPLRSLLPAQRRCLQPLKRAGRGGRGGHCVRVYLSISLYALPLSMHYSQCRSIGTHTRNFLSPEIEICFHNRGRIFKIRKADLYAGFVLENSGRTKARRGKRSPGECK